ncbi:MAG: NADH-quinone oxidoreductase subunit H [Planctomycetota bacterium]|jgi:NADH-quinone oxidoreductase subunit H
MPLVLIWLLKTAIIFGGLLGTAALMTLAERKFSAWIQYRIGPNRVGPFGLLQPLADGVKLFFKEELVPEGANKWMFRLAPAMVAFPAMMTVAVVPFAGEVTIFGVEFGTLSITDLDIGIIYVLAIGGLSVYGVILGGWASNSKYSLIGGLRASAQMISYELALILTILSVVALTGSLDLRDIVAAQNSPLGWNILIQPVGFLLFVVSTFAETNRHPFDFAECEPELVGGFHTEYSSMRFGLFFLGEYCAMVVMASLTVTLFLGGPSVPFWADAPWFVELASFLTKTSFFLFLFIWVRWTLPRFRFDQLMGLGWKIFLPISLANLLLTGIWISAFGG